MTKKKVLLSGIQPSGNTHIGNYFGMMKQMVDNQDEYVNYTFIVDYHALTTVKSGKELAEHTYNIALDFLALGLDPKKVVLFKQSDVPVHTELAWILNCLTPAQAVLGAHAFKDAQEAGKKEITAGLLTYPILQVADILLYDVNLVPVGKDQAQHIEMARDIARKFNNLYGKTFVEPKAVIKEDVGTIVGSDGRKMSKSYGNQLALFATEEETVKYIKGVTMDSKGVDERKNPDEYALYEIAKLFVTSEQDKELRSMFENGGVGYGDIKMHVADLINDYLRPMREKRRQLAKNPAKVKKILEQGGKKASKVANKKMNEVREKIGLVL